MNKSIITGVAFFVTSLTCAHGFAGQKIQLSGQFSSIANKPSITLIIHDEDTGAVSPVLIDLTETSLFKEVNLIGDHYKIIEFSIQYNGGSYNNLCDVGQSVDNMATIISLNGAVGVDQQVPYCSVRYAAIIPSPQAIVPEVAVSSPKNNLPEGSATGTEKPAASDENQQGYKEIAKYLTALSNNCSSGNYVADINTNVVTYAIQGRKNADCEVQIAVGKGKPLHCLLNQDDIAVIASKDQIDALNSGKPSASKAAANIMAQRCHTAS